MATSRKTSTQSGRGTRAGAASKAAGDAGPPSSELAAQQVSPPASPAAKKVTAKKVTANEVAARTAAGGKPGAAMPVAAKPAATKKAAPKKTTAGKLAPKQSAKAAAQRPPRADVVDAADADTAPAHALPTAASAGASGPAHSAIVLVDGDRRVLQWRPGHACPPALQQAALARLDADGHLRPDDDAALPLLLGLATASGHRLQVDDAVWPHVAADRDARHRLRVLEAAYPQGPASAALQQLLRTTLPTYQAEGALWAVVAGRALIADERGLGKGVQAIAAVALWRRHFGLHRVLLLCAPALRATWQRAWQRLAGAVDGAADGAPTQIIDGGLHQRQALWSGDAELRILDPRALADDAAHVAHWAPELILVDEPQQLDLHADDWAVLHALGIPQALVLCSAPLGDAPALLEAIVDWLDLHRQGPLAALRRIAALRDDPQAAAPADAVVERLDDCLSRLMLQRERDEVAAQLPPVLHSERVVALAPASREVHDLALARARRLLAGWQRGGYLSDADQWRLGRALRDMQLACCRADPGDAHSALAEPIVQALQAQLDDWQLSGPLSVAVQCASAADRDQLAQRLALPPQALLWLEGEPVAATPDAVLQVGVPWAPRRDALVAAGDSPGAAPAGQQWLHLVARHGIDAGLFDTLASRRDAPCTQADGGGRDFLAGAQREAWLRAVQAALLAIAADTRTD